MSQAAVLLNLLSDYEKHSTPEILEKVYGGSHLGIARIGARIFDIKKKYGYEIDCFRDKEKDTVYYYQLKRHERIRQDLFVDNG